MTEIHPSLTQLADLIVSGELATQVGGHVQHCSRCTQLVTAMDDAAALLAGSPPPAIPVDLAYRLRATIAAESARAAEGRLRAEREEQVRQAAGRTQLGTFGANLALEEKDFSIEARHRVAAENRSRRAAS